jgi:hypothetical protein
MKFQALMRGVVENMLEEQGKCISLSSTFMYEIPYYSIPLNLIVKNLLKIFWSRDTLNLAFIRTLLESQTRWLGEERNISKIRDQFDSDHDGKVNKDEFKAKATELLFNDLLRKYEKYHDAKPTLISKESSIKATAGSATNKTDSNTASAKK